MVQQPVEVTGMCGTVRGCDGERRRNPVDFPSAKQENNPHIERYCISSESEGPA